MAVLTFGNVLHQCMIVTGIRQSETRAYDALKGGVNTAHTMVCRAAAAEGLPWTRRIGCPLSITPSTVSVILPDGTTVTDANGVIPVKCLSVSAVRSGAFMRPLRYRPKDVYEAEVGRLEDLPRGVPQFFDPYGYNSSRQQLLWLMPLPSAADTIYVDYIAGLVFLTSEAQELMPPEEDGELVVQKAIACVNARDTIDQSIVAAAERNADWLWRSMLGTPQLSLRYPTPPQMFGNFT